MISSCYHVGLDRPIPVRSVLENALCKC